MRDYSKNKKPKFVQLTAWWCQATDHHLNQYLSRSMSPYAIISPPWVKQCWLIINWTLGNKLKFESKYNHSQPLIFIQQNPFEKSLCKTVDIFSSHSVLTHWGRVMHQFVSELNIISSDNGLSPNRRQAIIWTKAGLLLMEQTSA